MKRPSMSVLCYRHLTNITAPICETKRFLQLLRVRSKDSYRYRQQDATVCQNLLFQVYMKLNIFRATHRPSSGA
jgi:hypothetical protein